MYLLALCYHILNLLCLEIDIDLYTYNDYFMPFKYFEMGLTNNLKIRQRPKDKLSFS